VTKSRSSSSTQFWLNPHGENPQMMPHKLYCMQKIAPATHNFIQFCVCKRYFCCLVAFTFSKKCLCVLVANHIRTRYRQYCKRVYCSGVLYLVYIYHIYNPRGLYSIDLSRSRKNLFFCSSNYPKIADVVAN
jgi:hypothetical protein